MRLDSDDFELFGLERRHALDRHDLDARWRRLHAEVHPDRHAAAGAAGQRVAMQWATRLNEAYQRLKDPLARAAYLCELGGVAIAAEDNTAMPTAFLAEQLEWREALEEARTPEHIEAIAADVAACRERALRELAELLDVRHDFAAAAQKVRALMFVDRFAQAVERQLEAIES